MCALQIAAGYVLHVGSIQKGTLRVGDKIMAAVDLQRRARIVPNHTFTHVLNLALREVNNRSAWFASGRCSGSS